MKILFTHGYFLQEDARETEIMKPYVPLGMLCVSAYLEQKGYNNEIFDSTFRSFENLTSNITLEKPDILAIYTNLMTKINVLKIVNWVRSQENLNHVKIILGGPEVRNHAESFLRYGVNAIVIGEGEETMLELVKYIDNPLMSVQNLADIKGVAWLNNNELVVNEERTLIKDLDTLPIPNRKKIDLSLYFDAWKSKHGYSMMNVSTMRGCPYSCKWCSRAVYGGTYRRRSPAAVAAELAYLKETYNPDRIWFVDDVFTIHHKWLLTFAEEVVNANAIIPYEIISRADRLNEEVLAALKKSGCFRIWIGAESGSQRIIDAMDRKVDVYHTRHMIQMVKNFGIEAGTFIMLGYPGEEKADIEETIKHLVVSDPTEYTLTIAYPIKGTRLYNEVENTLVNHHLSWENSTDRDLDFKRTYPRQYYVYAMQWVRNEVYRQTRNKKIMKEPWLWLRSQFYQFKMEWARLTC